MNNPLTEKSEEIDFISPLTFLNADAVKQIITNYKNRVKDTNNKDEVYKWGLVQEFGQKWDDNAPDFPKMLESIKFANLVYPIGLAVLKHITNDYPEASRINFKMLYDESLPLKQRIVEFQKTYRALYDQMGYSHLNTHQDERGIATYLAFRFPDKYPFYKDSFYQKFCKLLGVESKSKGEKYLHYLDLVRDFTRAYVNSDPELLDIKASFLPIEAYQDPSNLILAQDILYQILDKGKEEIVIGNSRVYKISMGTQEFNQIKFLDIVNSGVVIVYRYTPAKGSSSMSQGECFEEQINIGDYFYLTNGNSGIKLLGRFTGDARPTTIEGFVDKDWLERPFETILDSINLSSYKGRQKWWTPNHNSTCIRIDDLGEANNLIFIPYFNAELKGDAVPSSDPVPDPTNTKPKSTPKVMPLAKNTILYGPPGTGKTYSLKNEWFERFIQNNVKQYVFTTFHQSLGYEDFIEGIKPFTDSTTGKIHYAVKPGIFREIADSALKDPTNNYAIFIDEINRGNVSAIFGELITLIEEDKRLGKVNQISCRLPYSNLDFSVPDNLYIIGTMNTADRSVEALDTALRRRFSFIEMSPNPELIKNATNLDLDLGKMLTTINKRLVRLLDRDHQIGHSYFMGIAEASQPELELKAVFANKILPLLQEYFYNNYAKIGAVLGNGFIKKAESTDVIFPADFTPDDYEVKEVYELQDPMKFQTLKPFKNIYE